MPPPTFLLKNLIRFGRLLRAVGLDVGPGQVIDLAAALEYVDIGNRDDFYHAARALFAHRRADLPLFDQAFQLFWRTRTVPFIEMPAGANPQQKPRAANTSYQDLPFDEEQAKEARPSERVLIEIHQTYSPLEVLRKKDFERYSPEEIQQARQLMAAITWHVGERRTRRKARPPR